jgi:hypothetical protein
VCLNEPRVEIESETINEIGSVQELKEITWRDKSQKNIEINELVIQTNNFSQKERYVRDDIEEMDDSEMEAISSEMLQENENGTSVLDKMRIEGPENLQNELKALISRYEKRFSSVVDENAARLPPFELRVNQAEWEVPANRLGPRRMDVTRSEALRKQCEILIENKIIEPSTEAYYSPAFMVPKKNPGEFRLVVDYKNLNKATSSEAWPIPNIRDTLERLGSKKCKYFAVFDLTSGYYQAPVHANARRFTSFSTPSGIYQWLRLPMGLKGAPSYFQRVMSTIVLSGIVMYKCEIYLDDIIVFGRDEIEFIQNLEEIFKRFEKFNVTLNPRKCILGVSEVEYVGHKISSDGLHFTREKLDSVLNIEKPTTQKKLKSFLGLCNWFRDHVRDISTISKPLQDMVVPYQPSQRLNWDERATESFESLRQSS